MTPDEQALFDAARENDLPGLSALLEKGVDPNVREGGDNTYAMHWAAASGNLEVVKMLADAGGDIVGKGDDHEMEVIGWASCWEGCNDDAHRKVVDFLISRGARHHIFSAIATDDADEVRRIVSGSPAELNRRMSRNELHQLPLHFAVRMRKREMVDLLMELGADPLGTDSFGFYAAAYATVRDVDLSVMQRIREMTRAELESARRGNREPNVQLIDTVAALALGDFELASRLKGPAAGALHLMSKRGDTRAVEWLLSRSADPNALWAHWDADVTPLHLAALAGHVDIARMLLDAGADPRIKDTKHDSDPLGWAEFFQRPAVIDLLSEAE